MADTTKPRKISRPDQPGGQDKPNRPGRPPVSESELRTSIASFRGKPAFRAWFESARKHMRFSASTLIEMAVVEYAANHGFDEEAPER